MKRRVVVAISAALAAGACTTPVAPSSEPPYMRGAWIEGPAVVTAPAEVRYRAMALYSDGSVRELGNEAWWYPNGQTLEACYVTPFGDVTFYEPLGDDSAACTVTFTVVPPVSTAVVYAQMDVEVRAP